MTTTAADVMIETIHSWGVEVVFGVPGDGIQGILEALHKRRSKLRFIQARHQEAAALMAGGYAKCTGKIGFCLASSGAGAIRLLTGLYDAKMDGQPVLAITGLPQHHQIDTFGRQDVATDRLLIDVAAYNTRVMGATHVERVTHLACRAALSYRGVAHIAFPVDIQQQEAKRQRGSKKIQDQAGGLYTTRARLPYEGDIRQAAEILNSGKKVVILAGRGAMEASEVLEYLAEKLCAPIVKALLGKAAVPDDSPYTTGVGGPLGTRPSQIALQDCETLLLVGTSFPYQEYLPRPGQARALQIDIDPTRIGLRYPVEIGLVGDCQRTLKELLPMIEQKNNRNFLEKAQKGMREWWVLMENMSNQGERPLKPQAVAWELGKRLRENAILACDSGEVTAWWARKIKAKRGQIHTVSGNLASQGCSLPYAIAAQIAYPDRQCVAFTDEGGFSLMMADFATCIKYSLPVKVILLKNDPHGRRRTGNIGKQPKRQPERDLQPIDFTAFATACGGAGVLISSPEQFGALIEKALDTPGPVLVEALVDPLETPLTAKESELPVG